MVTNGVDVMKEIRAPSQLERMIEADGVDGAVAYYSALTPGQRQAMKAVLMERSTVPRSRAAYAKDIKIVLEALVVDPKKATKVDVDRAIGKIQSNGGARKRISLLRAVLRESGKLKLMPRRVDTNETAALRDDEILAKADLNAMIGAAGHTRNAALLATMWETAGRIHEVLSLRVGSVYPANHNGKLRVQFPKVKVRGFEHSLLLVESTAHVQAWLDARPGAAKSEPLFPSFDVRGKTLGYTGAMFILKDIAARAGIKKPVRPHAFRHGRITELLRAGHSDAMVKKIVGLSPKSNMLARYGHLVTRDADNALLAMAGEAPLPETVMASMVAPVGDMETAMPDAYSVMETGFSPEQVAERIIPEENMMAMLFALQREIATLRAEVRDRRPPAKDAV